MAWRTNFFPTHLPNIFDVSNEFVFFKISLVPVYKGLQTSLISSIRGPNTIYNGIESIDWQVPQRNGIFVSEWLSLLAQI